MASVYDNRFNRSGIYGSPVASLGDIKLPKNPNISTPKTVQRGGITDPTPGKNNDILPDPTV